MIRPIIATAIESEHDVVSARQRARQIGAMLGFDAQDQTRIATAVSEIARNAFTYAGGGRVEYALDDGRPNAMVIRVLDKGPGIAALGDVLAGLYRSESGMGIGIRGARRLMDDFKIDTAPGQGTTVTLRKLLPRRASPAALPDVSRIAAMLSQEAARDPLAEVRQQNRELLDSLEALRQRQEELTQLNKELADTNRGVVALYAELDQRAEQLRRANELKTRFLSNMTHELRTPLNAILAISGLLLDHSDGPLTPEQEKQVGYVRQSARALRELVDDLLDIAKAEAGKTTVTPAEFSAEDLFGALRGMLRPLKVGAAVELRFELPPGLPRLYGDERKVSQVLRNFVSNALKFTERGEVVVTASLAPSGERVRFAVRDTGIGIAPEHQALIFEEFAQIDSPLQRRTKGTGLGLPLSKKLAELMGGAIHVDSAPGRGSTFTLEIPTDYGAARREAPPMRATRVLIIDDDEMARYTLRRTLRDKAEVMEAASGIDGLHQAAAERPDAIMLDLAMPDLDGFEVLARLGDDPATRDIPVFIVTSALIQERDRPRLTRALAVVPKDQLSHETVATILSQVGGAKVDAHAAS